MPLHRSYTRFVILSAARTGSALLASMLNSSPHIVCFREIFNKEAPRIGYQVAGYDAENKEDMELRDRDFEAFLERRIFTEHAADVRAVGYKMPYEHFLWFPEMLPWLGSQTDIHVVHLRRRNMLRSLVSLRIAERTGEWVAEAPYSLSRAMRWVYVRKAIANPMKAVAALRGLYFPKQRGRPHDAPGRSALREPVTLSVKECKFYFEWSERMAAEHEEALKDNPTFQIRYIDAADQTRALDEAQMFLGAPPKQLTASTKQQAPEPLRELLTNFEELREAFQGTSYAWFFE